MEAGHHTSQDELIGTEPETELMTDGVAREVRNRQSPFRRFTSIGGRNGVDAGFLERMEAELALLREENARLRFERAQRPDAGPMIDKLRSLSGTQNVNEDEHDEAWHLIGEALVMRDVLIDVCKEIGQTAITLQTRLSALTPDLPAQASPPAQPAQHELSSAAPSAPRQ